MNEKVDNDFAKIVEQVQEQLAPAHPFGSGPSRQRGRGPSVNVRQTTRVFQLPEDAPDYDDVCNRAWAGEIEIRYEDRHWTKEGDMIVALCWFDARAQRRSNEVEAEGDREPIVKHRELP